MGLITYKYWDLKTAPCNDDENTCIKKIRKLVMNATNTQINNETISCMLSGGLDSSILSTIAKNKSQNLNTFSIEYENNKSDFISNNYQPTIDSDYVKIMQKHLNTNHSNISFNANELYNLLVPSMINRDMPGMADVDSSMLAFCMAIKEKNTNICLSGECSDEIFGGYPWFYDKKFINTQDDDGLNFFPWCLSKNIRENLINKDIISKNEISEYIDYNYKNTLKNVTFLNNESEENKKFRKVQYLTIKWFMNTLLERTERAANYADLDVRIPFADYKIFEYVYNIPYNLKLGLNKSTLVPIEKSLLRKAFENDIPKEVLNRKKSPFPKTYDPKYLELVEQEIKIILTNKNDTIFKLIDKEYLTEIINTKRTKLN
ncbi:MAG: asparagine synthase C-terminal domain-containing protein [Clostridia bacterium]